MTQPQSVEWGVASTYEDGDQLVRTVEMLIESHYAPSDLRLKLYGAASAKLGCELLERSLTATVVNQFISLNKPVLKRS